MQSSVDLAYAHARTNVPFLSTFSHNSYRACAQNKVHVHVGLLVQRRLKSVCRLIRVLVFCLKK